MRKTGHHPHLLTALDRQQLQIVDSIESCQIRRQSEPITCYFCTHQDELTYDPAIFEMVPVRAYLETLAPEAHALVFRGLRISDWSRKTIYCGQCGESMKFALDEAFAKVCQQGHKTFLNCACIVLVMVIKKSPGQDSKILMVRKSIFPAGMYTHVAGFVDPGENFETAVRREVKEKTGISISHIQYFGNQSWPFPDGHLIGFQAEYAGGEFQIQDTDEIEDVQWFSRAAVKQIQYPAGVRFSLSHQMTAHFLQQKT